MLEKVTAGEVVREVIYSLRARNDVAQVLEAILTRTRDMLEASEAYLMLLEGDSLRLHAAVGLPQASVGRVVLGLNEGLEGLAVERGELVAVPDASRHPRFADPFGRAEPVGAMAVIPLGLRGRVSGVIAVTRPKQGQFGGSNLWWLEVIGALAALAIEDDRIYRTQERRARQAEVLSAVNALAADDEETSLPRLVATLARALGVSRVDVLLVDEEGKALVSRGLGYGLRHGEPRDHVDRLALAAGGPIVETYTEGKPYLCNDIQKEPELSCQFADEPVGSLLSVPIVVSGERRGVLYVANDEPATLSEDDVSVLSIVAARVGALIEAGELRQQRQRLQRAEAEAQARQEFIGVVSHELKTPLAVIQAYTDLLMRRAEKAGGDPNTDVVRRIADQAERMLGLVERVLDLQRLETGLFPLELSHFDIVALARRLVEETQATTGQHKLSVEDSGQVFVLADRRRVEEVLQNLLDNAIKFSPEGGDIKVSVRLAAGDKGDEAVVMVRDRGLGIAAEDQGRVFDRFYQGRNRLGRGHIGLGLGLYISREIVHRHGGKMWLESTPGAGSAFYFSLPASGPEGE